MMRTLILFAIPILFITTSCDEDVTGINPDGDATYRLTFTGTWSEADHGTVPGNAHFTTIIGLTHNAAVSLFDMGSLASDGVEEVAETGVVTKASEEIDEFIEAGTAFSKLVISVSGGPAGTGSGEFTVSEDRPYLSAITMIAPTPDWFCGVHEFKLYNNGVWVDDQTFNVNMYDAGTEDGDQFSLDNPDTDPVGNIAPLTESNASVLSNGTAGIAPIGTLRIQRIN